MGILSWLFNESNVAKDTGIIFLNIELIFSAVNDDDSVIWQPKRYHFINVK